jgi:hypothetical protein
VPAWPVWSGYAAAVSSVAYGGLGLRWALGGDGFPFGPVDLDRMSGSILEGSPVEVVAPLMAALGLLGGVVGVVMARGVGTGWVRAAVLVLGWTAAAGLTLVVPDYFLIGLLAFSPLLLVFAFTGVPGPQDGLGDILYWHRTNLVLLFLIGLLWAAATLAYQRRTRGACAHCGRRDGTAGHAHSPAALLRWGRWAVVVACLAPLPYEITRIAWWLGFPLGITDDFLRMMQATPGMLEVGLGCAVASALGGVLTQGLVRRWGEVYPRWVRFRAGRRVPPALAVVPAAVVAVVLVPAGVMNVRAGITPDGWGLTLPSVFWLVWAVALGAAALAYHLRRRGACRRCGLGARLLEEVRSAV